MDGDQNFLNTVGFGYSQTQPEVQLESKQPHQLSIKQHHQRSNVLQ
jgi:hypothetical protein